MVLKNKIIYAATWKNFWLTLKNKEYTKIESARKFTIKKKFTTVIKKKFLVLIIILIFWEVLYDILKSPFSKSIDRIIEKNGEKFCIIYKKKYLDST